MLGHYYCYLYMGGEERKEGARGCMEELRGQKKWGLEREGGERREERQEKQREEKNQPCYLVCF